MSIAKEFLGKHIKYLLSFLLFSQVAFASFLVEPHFNKVSGTFERADTEGDMTGEYLGLRLAYTNKFFMIGINLEKGHYSYDSEVSATKHSHYNGGGVGTFLGFHFFDRLRIWTGYLNSVLEANGNKDQRFFGQQVEFGIGYRLWKNIFVNYSYINNFFTQEENDITGETGSIEEIIKVKSNSLSISSIFVF